MLVISVYSQDNPRIIIDIPTLQKPWNNIDWNNDSNRFQFAIVTDRTGGHRPGIFSKGISKLNLLQPEFVMSVGDLIEGYTEDTVILDNEWTEFMGFIDELEAPFFYVPGNHDITNKVMQDKWKELFGVTYYHFIYNDVLFLCLDSEDNYRWAGRGTIDDEQYAYIQKTLEENQDVKWTLVFLHQPLWVQEETKRWKDVEALLADRPHNVFAGHYHRYWKTERNNGKYIALATTGGGSKLRGTGYGEFDHVVWVTMTEEGPLLANLLLDGIWDENVMTDDVVELVRNKPFPVDFQPVFVSDPSAEKVTTEIRVTNDSDYPMHVKLSGKNHPSLFYQLEKTSIDVPPNDVVLLSLEIDNFQKVNFATTNPIVIHAEITYAYQGTDVVFSNPIKYLPLYRYTIPQTTTQIKVDGKLDEWHQGWIEVANHKGSPFEYKGNRDCELRFATSFDEENLYLAIQVMDDEIYQNEDVAHWNQDVVVVGLDARPEELSYRNSGNGRGRDWLAILMTYNEEDAIYNRKNLPEEMSYKITRHNGGAYIEMSLPVSYLNEKQMKDWSNLRLGIGYYDFDDDGESRTEHFWYPAWNSPDTFNGSGMMFKGK